MKILEIRDIKKAYFGRDILKGASLTINNDEIVAVMGRSGGGKTTLLLCILGFVQPDEGVIAFDGQDLLATPLEERQIGYVPQNYGLFPHLSVGDNIAFGLMVQNKTKEECDATVKELLDVVELSYDFVDRNVEHLSGGEKQRVALARALAIKPKLFLLDEPLSAIDEEMRASVGIQLRNIIKKLGIPAIIISHDTMDAKVIADVIYRMEDGILKK